VAELTQTARQRVVEVASRKGVMLDLRDVVAAVRSADEAAAAVDVEIGQIVTPVLFVAPRPDGRLAPIACLVSGGGQVDAGLLAAVAGESHVRRASARETLELTGFGGEDLPPLGYRRDVRVVMDQNLDRHQWVWASAGTALFRVSPAVLRMLANAVVAPIADYRWAPAPAAAMVSPRLQFEAGSAS
jgi:prolyl-tRNA editing enzyme YbaK/EbsC (Cys-tRNA(Pro) deacylase)